MSLDYQELLYDPIYQVLGVAATLTTSGGDESTVTVLNLTKPSSFGNIGVEFQTFSPAVKIRMSEVVALSLQDDVLGGELTVDGKTWSIKSYEYNASPNGNSDGEVRLILKDDLNV